MFSVIVRHPVGGCLLAAMLLAGRSPLWAEDKPDAKKRANFAASKEKLEKLVHAMYAYHGRYSEFPAASILSPDGEPTLSWRVTLLPFLGGEAARLYKEFRLIEPWDSPHNKKLLAKMPKVYTPVAGKPKEPYATYYQVFTGPNTPFPRVQLRGPRQASFKDGLANTLLIVEAGEAVPWTKPADLVLDPKKPLPGLGGMFEGVFHGAMGDGIVRRFRRHFDEKVMRLVIDPRDGRSLDFSKVEASDP
jgi:hypothetical protein